MLSLKDFFEGGIIAIVFVLLVLPYLYMYWAAQLQSECTEAFKAALARNPKWGPNKKAAFNEAIEDAVHVFQVNWWYVAAFTLIMVLMFKLDLLVEVSAHFKNVCKAKQSILCQMGGATTAASECTETSDSCRTMKLVLSLYTLAVGILFAACLYWERIMATRKLRSYYID